MLILILTVMLSCNGFHVIDRNMELIHKQHIFEAHIKYRSIHTIHRGGQVSKDLLPLGCRASPGEGLLLRCEQVLHFPLHPIHSLFEAIHLYLQQVAVSALHTPLGGGSGGRERPSH